MTTPRATHVIITGGADHQAIGQCTYCQQILRWHLPMSIESWSNLTNAFLTRHANCQPPQDVETRMDG